MSRVALSRNVQWRAEGAIICVYSRAKNHLNLSSLRSGIFDGRTKEKTKKTEKHEGPMLHDRNFDG